MNDVENPTPPAASPQASFFRPSRIVLWLGVLVLGLCAAFQYYAHNSWHSTFKALIDQHDDGSIRRTEIDQHIHGWAKRKQVNEFLDELVWIGLIKNYKITIGYAKDGLVMSVHTDDETNLKRQKREPPVPQPKPLAPRQ